MGPHVLIARLDSEGDVLLAGPAVRAVAASARRVTLLCGPRGRQAAELLPGVDAIIERRAEWIDPEPEALDRRGIDTFIEDIAAQRLDEAIILGSHHQSPLPLALLLRMAGVGRIGATSVDYPGSLLDVRHRIGDEVHEVQRSLALVEAMDHHLPVYDDDRLRVRRPGRRLLAPGYVVVHPGASVPARAWAPERHAALVAALTGTGRRVVVTGGRGERELTAFVAGTHAADLGGRTTLGQLADVLAGAACVVVGNTGPAHLAAAVATPVVSLYAPTVPPVRWRPWRVPHELLYVDVPCAGCRARVCSQAGHPCLAGVGVDDVVVAVERLSAAREALAA